MPARARPHRELHRISIALQDAAGSADDVDDREARHTFVTVKRFLDKKRRTALHERKNGTIVPCLEPEAQQSIFAESSRGELPWFVLI
jgi:hypothetical protein